MPLYDYHCESCGPFRRFRSIAERAAPLDCEECGAPAARTLTAPQLNLMSGNNRIAEARNEKSAHEPDVVAMVGQGSKPDPVPKKPAAAHRHAGHAHAHRPWMLGH
jgi:putative FmdB family regulatory protein